MITKSAFIKAVQCLKSLYLYTNFKHLKDEISPGQQAIYNRGTNVGMIARSMFRGGTDARVSPGAGRDAWLKKTRQLMESGTPVIYEAAFLYGQAMCAVDILVKAEKGWSVYEVKSASKVSPVYITDTSLQYYILKKSGLEPDDLVIITINNQYVRGEKLEPEKLFSKNSVLEAVRKNQAFIEEKLQQAMRVLSEKNIPEINIGEHCFSPYTCDFYGHCWREVPADSILSSPGVPMSELFELYHSGVKTLAQLPASYAGKKILRLHSMAVEKQGIVISSREELKEFISGLSYPLHFADFETIMPAVPLFVHTRPYQQIPFQYSLHIKESASAAAEHREFLAEPGADPRKEFIHRFLSDTAGASTILVYNATFERSILKGLAEAFPHLAREIGERISRFADLILPFSKQWVYHPAMKGSSSIKNVLPALVPEMNYSHLKIPSGTVAMSEYERMQSDSDMFRMAETRKNLLEYCRMDTLAMVRILEVLEKLIKS